MLYLNSIMQLIRLIEYFDGFLHGAEFALALVGRRVFVIDSEPRLNSAQIGQIEFVVVVFG